MQEIEYEDGAKTRELFDSLSGALEDAKQKAKKKRIKKITITKVEPKLVIPKKRLKLKSPLGIFINQGSKG